MITINDLYIDRNQGISATGCAFGYVGAETADLQGWFFDYPTARAGIDTADEINTIARTLTPDPSTGSAINGEIPRDLAEEALRAYLHKRLQAQESTRD